MNTHLNWWAQRTQRLIFLWPFRDRRLYLWAALVGLVVAVLITLVWLAGRYEASQVQATLERDTGDAVNDIRSKLMRDVQELQALHANFTSTATWGPAAIGLLREHRDWLRVEWRDAQWHVRAAADSPLRAPSFFRTPRSNAQNEVVQACQRAKRSSGPAYSSSYFVPQVDGMGVEVMDLCLPMVDAIGKVEFAVISYSLQEIMTEHLGQTFGRRNEVSFIEPDGTRLAIIGNHGRGVRIFSAQQLLDLPGLTLVLRMEGRRGAPDLFPNVLTALVTAMSIALVSVLVLLVKDSRRRLKAERDLADALAFRKAMEDSLVTGLRARDLQGRITYVNPAFCQMVGFEPAELLGQKTPMPYWPPEMVGEYQQRQAIRLAGNTPPREGYESVFVHKDGTRISVLIIEAPLINVLGKQTGWMSAFLDISEQRRVEEMSRTSQERLQASARLATVGEMASLLSHELNQPLAAIASYAAGSLNLLRDQQVDTAAQTLVDLNLALGRIAEQAGRAGKIINSVHDFVRRREQDRESVSPKALIDAIMPLVNLQAHKLQVKVITKLDDKLHTVWCDRTMVEQVLLNLARNGMQAMDGPDCADRRLLIQVRRAASNENKQWVEFAVADLGCGISEEVARQLFSPFFTTKPEGMGLGLSLCRTVIEQHGGHLGFDAHVPQGTIFRFTLPVPDLRETH
jgi:two-component system sensor histidine kinase DctS